MTQNVYDDAGFFAEYGRLPRSLGGLDAAPEWPALRALLPPLRGRAVLDLGCGYGWLCRWARAQGAARVVGVDLSERMLERARAETADAGIAYVRADLEDLPPPPGPFDLVHSALAFHYVVALPRLLGRIRDALGPGGALVFSVEHPLYTAPSRAEWAVDAAGRATWPLDRYLDEGPRTTTWLTRSVTKQHRTIATYVNALVAAGFALTHLDEWGPSAEQVAAHPEWANERQRPPFLLVAARRA